jgi:hypothetical protein
MRKSPLSPRLTTVNGKQVLLVCAISVGGAIVSTHAGEPAMFPLWRTVSPNGQYVVGWSTTGSTNVEKMPQTDETDASLENWIITVQTRERIVKLPECRFWTLPSGMKPNRYDLNVAWASDSSAAMMLLDWRRETELAFYVEPGSGRLLEASKQMEEAFQQVLRRSGHTSYRRWSDSYNLLFDRPWLEERNVLSVRAYAAPMKSERPEPSEDFTYLLTFRVNTKEFVLIKSVEVGSDELEDRSLNESYRGLLGLLSEPERQALIEQQRIWIQQRSKTKGATAKDQLTQDRVTELDNRTNDLINQLSAEDVPLEQAHAK